MICTTKLGKGVTALSVTIRNRGLHSEDVLIFLGVCKEQKQKQKQIYPSFSTSV